MHRDIDIIIEILLDRLPFVAKGIIAVRSENENFIDNPDDPTEHVPNWHQFGIITHTKIVLESYTNKVKELFEEWGIKDRINKKLQSEIDGITKGDLIKIGIILHDIGKFARNIEVTDGTIKHNFYGHEAISEKLIITENSLVNELLKDELNLSVSQIKYIGRMAGLHFELGKSRDAARKSIKGYSIEFSNSEECEKALLNIASLYPDYKEEIGLLFLCDSLGKTDIRIKAKNDEEIEKQEIFIYESIKKRNLNPKLVTAIKQLPVNMAICKKYLQIIYK
jgi:hypothetical protein